MEWIEITAKTVDEAKERALDELGIDHDEAEFVVLEEPRRGLFRQVRGSARVRARVKPRTPRAKTERRQRRGRKPKNGQDAADRSDQRETAGKKTTKPAGKSSAGRTDRKGRGADHEKQRRTTGNDGKSGAAPARDKSDKKERGTEMTMTLDEQVAATESFLAGLLDAMGIDGRITTERADDANAHVNIEGEDLGMLIGPRGNTMNAIQDLTRVTLQKQAAGSWEGHVHVDVNGYRAKRREALVAFVEKVAGDVVESGKAKALEPMSSADRKVVHDTVNAIDGVTTSSEGRDPRRWVQISPDDA